MKRAGMQAFTRSALPLGLPRIQMKIECEFHVTINKKLFTHEIVVYFPNKNALKSVSLINKN